MNGTQPSTMMTAAQAAKHWGFNTTSAFRKRVHQLLPDEFIHREGRRLYFDRSELDQCMVRVSELPPDEQKVRPCDLRFKKSELHAWMITQRLEFRSKTMTVFEATKDVLPEDWADARKVAIDHVPAERRRRLCLNIFL